MVYQYIVSLVVIVTIASFLGSGMHPKNLKYIVQYK